MAPKSRKLQPGEGTSTGKGKKRAIEEVVEEEENRGEREKRLEQESWAELIPHRNFKCERQVIMPTNPEVEAVIRRRGIDFVTQKVLGYVPSYVRQFYARMEKPDRKNRGYGSDRDDEGEILSKVEGKVVRVTPQIIADLLRYERPPSSSLTEFTSLTADRYKELMLKDPTKEYARNKIPIGDLQSKYSTMNKILHYNIRPKAEKQLGYEDLDFLYMFMSDHGLDVADLIFSYIREFRFTINANTEMPFSYLISRLCIQAEVKGYRSVRWTKGKHGPLSRASQKKSEALSVREAVPRGLPEGSGSWKKKLKMWLDTLFCGQQEIREIQKRTDRRLDYCVEELGRMSGRPYVSPPRDVAAGEGTSDPKRRTKESARKRVQEMQEHEIEEESEEEEDDDDDDEESDDDEE